MSLYLVSFQHNSLILIVALLNYAFIKSDNMIQKSCWSRHYGLLYQYRFDKRTSYERILKTLRGSKLVVGKHNVGRRRPRNKYVCKKCDLKGLSERTDEWEI